MEKKKTGIIIAIVCIIIIGVIILIKDRNNLSAQDTFDRFIRLVENGEYEEAKKYTTSNFTNDLSNIKDLKISKMSKNYKLSEENKYVYKKTTKLFNLTMEDTYTFELKETFTGWKIDTYKYEINDNIDS